MPSAAGGPWDPIARTLAERLSATLGQPFFVENVSGATGMIGMSRVARSTDGHSLGVMFMPHVLIPSLFKQVTYDLHRDLVPVTQTHWTYNILVVHPDVPARTVDELLALVRKSPGKLSFASGGIGTPAHVMGEFFKQRSNTYIVHIPYRGPAALVQGLVAGQTELGFASAAATIPLVRSGRLRALAVTSPSRLEALPDVPSFAEVGFKDFDVRDWSGIVAPTSLPRAAIEPLSRAIGQVLADGALVDRMRQMGIYVNSQGPQPFAALIRIEFEKWREVIQRANIEVA